LTARTTHKSRFFASKSIHLKANSSGRTLQTLDQPVELIDIAGMLARLSDKSKTVMFYEGARFHRQRFSEYGERLAALADLVREGLQICVERYDEARRYIAECQARVAELCKGQGEE
jgi:hypothetical protein